MVVFARINRIGWVHLWTSREAYEQGEASFHFFNARIDPTWAEVPLTGDQRARLEAGELVEIEDAGWMDDLA